jgi:hypothetical protein
LTNTRQWDEDRPQPITLAEILALCQLMEWRSVEVRDRLVTHVQKLDSVWLEQWAKKHDDT